MDYHLLLIETLLLSLYQLIVICSCLKNGAYDLGDTPEIIESRGFNCEIHTIVTSDGYILKQFRIVHPKLAKSKRPVQIKPIVLQSGLFGSSDDFVDSSPHGQINISMLALRTSYNSIDYSTQGSNIGFLLANLGYDVWLTNYRCNYYSANHTKFEANSPEYWSTNMDEMATIDLPTIIDYVLRKTKQETLGYIGMSRGGGTMFALLSDRPEYADKVKPFIALAPAVFVGALLDSPWIRPFFENRSLFNLFLANPLECLPRKLGRGTIRLVSNPVLNPIWFMVKNAVLRILNFEIDLKRADVYISHFPAGSPCWDLVHFGQISLEGKFRKLDFGEKQNLAKYGTPSPPSYQLDKFRSKDLFLFNSVGDNLVWHESIVKLVESLKVKPREWITINETDFTHVNFIHGNGIEVKIFKEIVRILAKYS